ncbi:MAG: TolC family protein [Calditrichaceae bacterium]
MRTLIFVICFACILKAQKSLEYFIDTADKNSPVLNEYRSLQDINQLQLKLDKAENSAFHVSLSGDYLFAPYFNNHGDLISTNPSPDAIGYDAGITNGGLYSAQLNLERNIFNGSVLNALERQANFREKNYYYNFDLEKHNLKKQVTEQYLTAYHSLQSAQLHEEVVDNLQEQLKLTAEMVKKGYVRSSDYLLLKIELENQKINQNNTRNAYRSELLQLNTLCGITDTNQVIIQPVKLDMHEKNKPSSFLRKYNLDSLSLIAQQKLFETKYQPQIKVFANTGLNAVELDNIQRRLGMSAGISLSLAILDGNQKNLTRQQNRISRQSIGEYRRYAMNNITVQRSKLKQRIVLMNKNLQSLSRQIDDYRTMIDISDNQLQQGNISMIDYLTLLRGFTDLRQQRIDMEMNYQIEINNYNYWNW